MKFELVDEKNEKTGQTLHISDDVILSEPNEGLVHQLLMLQHKRPFRNAHTKTRREVRGGGKKPWRQKGTGRARAGSLRSPLFVGGGIAMGPRAHSIKKSMPQKARRKALCSVLSMQVEMLYVLESFSALEKPKTSEAVKLISSFAENQKTLVIMDQHNPDNANLWMSLGNISKVKALHWENLNPHDLLNSEVILIDKDSLQKIESWLITYKNRKGVMI